jgi:molybdopterin-binding protein
MRLRAKVFIAGLLSEDRESRASQSPRPTGKPYDHPVGEDGIDNTLRIGPAAAALGVSVDTLRRWERNGRVTFERRGNQRYISAEEVARLMRERSSPHRSSARNRLGGIVLAIKRDGVMAQVEMACGPYRIVSLMSREAADELGLEPGSHAEAVIKATGVVVETR